MRRSRAIELSPLAAPLVLVALLGACENQTTKDVVDQASRQAEQAREGTREAMDEASKAAEVAARKAEQEVQDGVASARDGIADARERYEVDERIALAKENLDQSMDDAAKSFEELAETSKQQANDLGEKSRELGDKLGEAGMKGMDIAPNSINCDQKPDARVCRIDPEVIAQLAEQPRLLAKEVSLMPKEGLTGRGLQLIRASKEGFTALLGLRQGDILVEINGVELSSFEAIKQLDEALGGKPEAKLIYERDGKREALTVMQGAP